MATRADVRQIALSLPGTIEQPGRFVFGLPTKHKLKHYVWVWLERVHPRQARVPNPKVIAVRVADELEKATLLGADPDAFFTEPHYDGYPAVLVRLEHITKRELRSVLTEAWRCVAPATAKTPRGAGRATSRRRPK